MPSEMPDESKYAIGGCCLNPDGIDPEWTCVNCGLERNLEAVVETPVGRISWCGILDGATMLTMPNGTKTRFYSLISMANSACLEWFHRSLP